MTIRTTPLRCALAILVVRLPSARQSIIGSYVTRPVSLASEENNSNNRPIGWNQPLGHRGQVTGQTRRQLHTNSSPSVHHFASSASAPFICALWGSQRRWFRNTGEKKPLPQHLLCCCVLTSTPQLSEPRILGLGRDREGERN